MLIDEASDPRMSFQPSRSAWKPACTRRSNRMDAVGLSRKKRAVERLHRRLRIFRWLRLYSTVSADTAANGERWRRRAVAPGSNVARHQCATLRCIKRCFGAEFHGRSHIETLPTKRFRSERTAGCSPVIPENTRYVCTRTTRWDKNVGTSSCKVGRIKRE